MPGWMEESTTNCECGVRIEKTIAVTSLFRNPHFGSSMPQTLSPLNAWRFSAQAQDCGQ